MDEPTTVFLHIPKTAGTTLHSALSWQYLGRPSLWLDRGDKEGNELRSLAEEERRRLQLVRGHMLYGVHELLPRPATYITMLRHPVSHVRSQYWYYQEEGTVWEEKSIQEILGNENSVWLDNQQVRRLSGKGNQKKNCDREDFEQARANLEAHFVAVGLVELFDESLILIKDRLNWSRPLIYRSAKVNRNSQRSAALGHDLRNLIMKTNQWDVKLYEWAEKRFETVVNRKKDYFSTQVNKLQRRIRLFGPALDVWRKMRTI